MHDRPRCSVAYSINRSGSIRTSSISSSTSRPPPPAPVTEIVVVAIGAAS